MAIGVILFINIGSDHSSAQRRAAARPVFQEGGPVSLQGSGNGVVFSGPGKGEAGGKKAALTFDDGPSPMYTQPILDILAEHEVTATFFVLGVQIEAHPGLLIRISEAGHEIGNHSHSHRDFRLLSWAQVLREVEETGRLIGEKTGSEPHLIRPPYGEITDGQLNRLLERGYRVVNWSVDPRDWEPGRNHPDAILRRVEKQLHPGAIIILHDGGGNRSRTVAILPDLIEMIKGRGYELKTVGELLSSER